MAAPVLPPHDALQLRGTADAAAAAAAEPKLHAPGPAPPPRLPFFERYLTLWVALCMVAGGLIGAYSPGTSDALAALHFNDINILIAICLWVMLVPMFLTLQFSALRAVGTAPAALLLTCTVNYAIKPFTMWMLGMLFLRVLYVRVIPDEAVQRSYVAGMVMLGAAPCTAMVFVWSFLMGGSTEYTLTQVAVNDLLMLALYVPTCAALIGATNLALPWATIATAVALFVAAPLALASAVRALVLAVAGEAFFLQRVVAPLKPLTTLALLAMLVLIFIFQGPTLASRIGDIFLLAVPITLQCVAMFALPYALAWHFRIPHERAAPAALIGTSNFFELAVALAAAVYGPGSPAMLATVVGVLVEVPLMLFFVQVCMYCKPGLDRRCAEKGGAVPAAPAAAATVAAPPSGNV
jgi:ACR3 family arsenite transporter